MRNRDTACLEPDSRLPERGAARRCGSSPRGWYSVLPRRLRPAARPLPDRFILPRRLSRLRSIRMKPLPTTAAIPPSSPVKWCSTGRRRQHPPRACSCPATSSTWQDHLFSLRFASRMCRSRTGRRACRFPRRRPTRSTCACGASWSSLSSASRPATPHVACAARIRIAIFRGSRTMQADRMPSNTYPEEYRHATAIHPRA